MPRLAARASPSRKAVSAQAWRAKASETAARTALMMPSLSQLARDRLPMVQNTTAESAWSGATYCSASSSAVNVNTRVVPSNTIISVVMPRFWLRRWMNKAAAIDTRKALTGTAKATADAGSTLTPRISPSAAPKLAAADSPSVNGLARGLFNTVCISRPATARLAPTTSADNATGKRMSHRMTLTASAASACQKADNTVSGL
ncbi:hypothetical protein D3C72_1666130 [compost metagenome]